MPITTAMKDSCTEIAPLLPGLAEAPEGQPVDPRVAAHLDSCGACRRSLRVQREMHGLLRARAATLVGRAPESLRARVEAVRPSRPTASRRWAPLRMPVAATLLLAFMGVMGYGLTSASSTVLAAQLALDHLKCAKLISPETTMNPVQAMKDWAQQYQWTPKLPSTPAGHKASLVGVRRCLYGHGHLAHLLYEVEGHTVSVFVMPRSEYPVGAATEAHDFLGQHAETWAEGDQSFAVVGDLPADTLSRLAREFREAE